VIKKDGLNFVRLYFPNYIKLYKADHYVTHNTYFDYKEQKMGALYDNDLESF